MIEILSAAAVCVVYAGVCALVVRVIAFKGISTRRAMPGTTERREMSGVLGSTSMGAYARGQQDMSASAMLQERQQPRELTRIEARAAHCAEMISQIENWLDTLTLRIEPFMGPPGPVPGGPHNRPREAGVGRVPELMDETIQRMESLVARIRDLTERL